MVEKDDGPESDSDDEQVTSHLIKQRKAAEEALLIHSATDPQIALTHDKNYYYLPWNEQKPCLYVCSLFEDVRKRLYHSNMIQSISDKMVRKTSLLCVTDDCF